MPFTLLKPDGIDLSQDFVFTGDVTGAGGGKVLQTVNTLTSLNTTMNSTSFADTGLSRTITCSATSSKVFGIVTMPFGFNANSQDDTSYGAFKILRDSTSVQEGFCGFQSLGTVNNFVKYDQFSIAFYDSPSSTSSLTYKLQVRQQSGTNGYVQIGVGTTNGCSMVLMEIGAWQI